MRKILLLFILGITLLSFNVQGQDSDAISYQAVVRNAKGELVKNVSIGMRISLLKGSISGTVEYFETLLPTTNANGLISVQFGNAIFGTIDWANGPYFIKTEIDLDGGSTYTITGTTQLLSVPYALHAKTAESISGSIVEKETDPVFLEWDKQTGITITKNQISDLNTITFEEKDGDITNEIQDLTLTGNSLKVTNNASATTINLTKYLDNTTLTPTQVDAIVAAKGYAKTADLNDDDASNEIQDLALTGNSLKVTGNASATTIDLAKYLDNSTLTPTQVDAIVAAKGYVKSAALNDDDATNEIQDLTLTGNSLKVTGYASATTIDLTKYLDNTTLTPTQVDAIVAAKGYVKAAALNDDDATNEIQDLTLTGNSLKVTNNASATTINLNKYLDNTTLTPTQVDAIVAAKGYIKAAAIATKAEINSPTFTGTPTLPTGTIAVTQSANNNSTKVATTAYVDNALATSSGAPDATTTTKGVIKLAGNLGGTADAPKLQVTGNAKGDMLYHDGTEWVRIPAGTDGQVLLMDETEDIPKWVDPSCLRRRVITTVENKTRMIKGEIRANGTVVSGSGFT
ncbi:MAG: hypothetical protein N4A59_06600, partial [Marinifilum sp.]|nr:hypothetical protein [Marinifilum sp.]